MEQIGKFPGSGGVPGGVAAFKSAASIMRIACTVQPKEFTRWHGGSGGRGGDGPALFCDGSPGVGKTFKRREN